MGLLPRSMRSVGAHPHPTPAFATPTLRFQGAQCRPRSELHGGVGEEGGLF